MSKYWNCRVIACNYFIHGTEFTNFAIHEVQYENHVPVSYGENSTIVDAEEIEELNLYVGEIQKALTKPILWGDTKFPQEYKK